MRPAIAFAAFFTAACAGSPAGPGTGTGAARPRTPHRPGPMPFSRRFPVVAALALLVCVACGEPTGAGPPATRADADSAFVATLRARLEAATEAGEFSGAVLVARDGRTLFEGAYGLADRERGVPNTPLTQFRVGSMNKMLTAVAALQLVQAGTLRLDAPLGTYGGYVVVVLSNFDPPAAGQVSAFILDRLPASTPGGGSGGG